MPLRDPYASEIPLVNQYHALIAAGQTAAGAEILIANPSLQECMINAEKLLKIYHAVIALERFFYDNVLDKIFRLGTLKGDWNSLMSSTADGDNKLNHFDVVRYPVDGVIQYFLVYEDGIVAGEIPTESEKYIQISMKGDKGDPGQTPIKGIDYVDGIDGAPGLGLSPNGAWVNNKEYYQYDLVSHNGYLWYALTDNLAEEPIDGSTFWQRIKITLQVATSTETPVNLEDGGLWLHMQDDGHIIMKTKNEAGEYVALMPETQAKYVFDEVGESLQKKIYRHYFDRDDVKITMVETDNVYTTTATLLNTTIDVAKAVMTDNLDVDGTATEEFTVYDETGVYVMYKCKKTYTDNGSGTQTCTPEIIV